MEKLLEGIATRDTSTDSSSIVVFNDHHNSFEHVIECFITILKHSPEQAEQCAMNIHNTGSARVKNGGFEELRPICEQLINSDLDATIE